MVCYVGILLFRVFLDSKDEKGGSWKRIPRTTHWGVIKVLMLYFCVTLRFVTRLLNWPALWSGNTSVRW